MTLIAIILPMAVVLFAAIVAHALSRRPVRASVRVALLSSIAYIAYACWLGQRWPVLADFLLFSVVFFLSLALALVAAVPFICDRKLCERGKKNFAARRLP